MVLALGAVRATGALGHTHPILGLGFAAIRALSGGYAILILLGNSSVAGSLVDGSGSAIGALGHTRSILGLGFAAIGSLSGCHAVLVFLRDGSVAGIRVDSSGGLAILAHLLTAQVCDAIVLREHIRSKQRTRQEQQKLHLDLHDYGWLEETRRPGR
jgi:hypothetical protein